LLERRDADHYPAPGVLIEVGGAKLHLRCIGEGSPTVIMISGSGAPSVVSYELQDRVSKRTRVCSYDRAGLGWSEPANQEQGLVGTTSDLLELIDQAGEEGPFILVPESYGGMIALHATQRWPERVAGLVLVDATEPRFWFEQTRDTHEELSRHTFMMQFGWRTGIVRAVLKYGQPDWIDEMSEENQKWFGAIYSRYTPGYGEYDPAFRLTDPAVYEDLKPGALDDLPLTVLVHGAVSSGLSPQFEDGWNAAQQSLAALSSASELIVAAETGHAMVGENPDFVAMHVLRMVDKVQGISLLSNESAGH